MQIKKWPPFWSSALSIHLWHTEAINCIWKAAHPPSIHQRTHINKWTTVGAQFFCISPSAWCALLNVCAFLCSGRDAKCHYLMASLHAKYWSVPPPPLYHHSTMDRYESIVCAHTRLNCKYLPLPPPCVFIYIPSGRHQSMRVCRLCLQTPNARTPHIFSRARALLIFRPDVNRETIYIRCVRARAMNSGVCPRTRKPQSK